ncbi:MAG: hypothetical protein R6X25_08495 [Candidatus Krumholzibacteriia bacterium]
MKNGTMDALFAEEKSGRSLDPTELLRVFLRRKWLFIVPFILCLAMVAVAIKTLTPIYASAGQIRVVIEGPATRLIENEYGGHRRVGDLNREVAFRIENLLTSPKFLEGVVTSMDLHLPYLGLEAMGPGTEENVRSPGEQQAIDSAARDLRRRIRVNSPSHLLFEIEVRDTDPQTAYVQAHAVLDHFLLEDRQRRMERSTTTRDFLLKQRDSKEQELEQAEQELLAFQRQMLSANLVGTSVNYQNLGQAEEALERLRSRFMNEDAQQIAELEQQTRQVLGELPPVSRYLQSSEIGPLVRELQDLEFEQSAGGAGRGGDLGTELGRLRIRLNSAVENRVALDYPQLPMLDRNAVTRYIYFSIYRQIQQRLIDRLARDIREFREFSTRQPEQSARLNELQQNVGAARNLLNAIEGEITQLNMNLDASASEIGYRVEVRQEPQLSWNPVEPDKMKLSMMGFVLSVGLGIGLVVVSVLLDRSFTSVEEIEATLGLPVIGTLPVVQDDHFERRRRLRLLRWLLLIAAILAVAAVGLLYIYPKFV